MLSGNQSQSVTDDIIRIEEEYYIKASSALADDRSLVLKSDELFGVFDRFGDIHRVGFGEQGIFFEGTRFLSELELQLNHKRMILLGSEIKKDNVTMAVDLTNPDYFVDDTMVLERDNIHVFRTCFLWNQTCYQRFRIKNYDTSPIAYPLTLLFSANFFDIFEVRGIHRDHRGKMLEPEKIDNNCIVLRYLGLDEVERHTRLEFSIDPHELTADSALFNIQLAPMEVVEIVLSITCKKQSENVLVAPYLDAQMDALKALSDFREGCCQVSSSNDQFNDWFNASFIDMHMLLTKMDTGSYPFAGIPWYSTAFGRDGIITALETLWILPDIARGTLAFLSSTQADKVDRACEAEPGKIIHETRKGEMAALDEIPFGRYYGSIDSTPLYILLAEAYFQRTNDYDFLNTLWPSIELALSWIENFGDTDGDGFVEYSRKAEKGLVQQGWKDSHDSVFYQDGKLAKAPIALCEVQGYVYAAYLAASHLAKSLNMMAMSERYEEKAALLKSAFHRAFWCDEIGTYAFALDGDKQQCRVITSNVGQCLFTGIVEDQVVHDVIDQLFSQNMFSGWGIRTVSSDAVRYNPMSYHNGSIWPHDNALIALGLKRYGHTDKAVKLLEAFLDASLFVEQRRLPELFCGFDRRPKEGPTPYPVACAPQAWAAGAVFLLLQAALGMTIDAQNNVITFRQPSLPHFIDELKVLSFPINDHSCDFSVMHQGHHFSVNLLKKSGNISIITEQ